MKNEVKISSQPLLFNHEEPTLLGLSEEEFSTFVRGKNLPEWFSRAYLAADLPEREKVIDTIFKGYLEVDAEARDWVYWFNRRVKRHFSDFRKQAFIRKALKLATVAHQYNRVEKRRYRKAEGAPYIAHCVSVAELLLRGEELDVFTIAAGLLHDVAEDVDLGDGLDNRSAWLNLIQDEFNHITRNRAIFGLSGSWRAGDLLCELVDGHTNKPLPTTPEELGVLKQTPFHRILTAVVTQGGLRGSGLEAEEPTEEDKKRIDQVVYNLGELFRKALSSPDHWRIFFLFIADSWHNLQTPEWVRLVKVLRGRVAASLAEWLGWYGVRSDIISMLVPLTNMLTPYAPLAKPGSEPSRADYRVSDSLPGYVGPIVEKLKQLRDIPELKYQSVSGWPIVYTDKPYRQGINGFTLPLPEMILKIPREDLEEAVDYLRNFSSWRAKKEVGVNRKGKIWIEFKHHPSAISRIVESIFPPRRRLDYLAKIGGRSRFMLRLQSDEPVIVDIFRNNSQVKPSQIPETGLFNNYLKDLDDTAWEFHLASFIGFLYELNLPFNAAEHVYPVVYDKRLIFIDGSKRLRDVLTMLGEEVKGREITVRSGLSGTEVSVSLDLPIQRIQLGSRRNIFRHRVVFPPQG